MIVGIDSMVLIYAGIVPRKVSVQSATAANFTVYAKLLLHMLSRDKAQVVLPTVAIAELLVPIPAAQKGQLISELSKRFICRPFDLHASTIAADLWALYRNHPHDFNYKSRNVLKSDVMILASAKAAGASRFYTKDKDCRKLADLIMEGHDLPTRDPEDMYAVEDIRRGDL